MRDTITGTAGGGFLLGGAGNDVITAGSGRTIIIGGTGSDTLKSGSKGDLLIAGTTDFDLNVAALTAFLQEWQSTASYATRIADLRAGVGPGGAYALGWGTTVHDDADADTLTGSADAAGDEFEWFFANQSVDQINNLLTGEQVN